MSNSLMNLGFKPLSEIRKLMHKQAMEKLVIIELKLFLIYRTKSISNIYSLENGKPESES